LFETYISSLLEQGVLVLIPNNIHASSVEYWRVGVKWLGTLLRGAMGAPPAGWVRVLCKI
jgi:hypothetical protein